MTAWNPGIISHDGSCGLHVLRHVVTIALTLAVAIGSSQKLEADFALYVDFDPLAHGIQDEISVVQGETFTANIVLDFHGDTSSGLDSYSFSVDFDPAAMTYVDNSAISLPLAGFDAWPLPVRLVPPRQITPFAAEYGGTSGQGPVIPIDATVGTIRFTAGTTHGTFTIAPYQDIFYDGVFDNDFQSIAAEFYNGNVTITAVPEPSSMCYVLAAFGIRMILCRRRVRRAIVARK